MKKFCTLLVASLLLGTTAFAAEQTTNRATIKVAGHTIATVMMAEQPKDAELVVKADPKATAVYNMQTGVALITGKFTVEVNQGTRRLLQMTVEDGTCTVEMGATAQ